MADIKRLLNKRGWTGRELGILELTNMAVMFRQALEGKDPKPIIDEAQFQSMINSIPDRKQGSIYNGYITIHDWLSINYNIAQTQLQQAQLQYRTISGYISDAIFAEDVYKYVEQLPAIMTQKQYDETKAARIEASFKGENGEELCLNVFDLIDTATDYYLLKLQKDPAKPNPLKAIRKKYIAQPVKSKLILSRWNKLTGEGYYMLPDGRRSDKLTTAERKALYSSDEDDELNGDYVQRVVNRAKATYYGTGKDEAKKSGTQPSSTWHISEETPEDLTKWEVLEQGCLLELYPADIDGSGDAYSDSNFSASMVEFAGEFKELVTAILKDIDKRYFTGDQKLSGLPLEKWGSTLFPRRQLYKMDFYEEQTAAGSDVRIFEGNRRALLNGVAIVRASDLIPESQRIDANGNYFEPDIRSTLSNFTLEAFFTDAENYADNVEIVQTARTTLQDSYYSVRGYDRALDMIASFYDVPDITVFKMGVLDLENKIDALNALIPVLYTRINDTDYGDADLKYKKLKVLKDIFRPIDYRILTIPEDNIKQAEKLLEDFKAFQPGTVEHFNNLLCRLHPVWKRRRKTGG